MQTQVLFEHPLNEKMRTWLRIEFLIQQLTVNLPIVDHAGALHFFRNVSKCRYRQDCGCGLGQ